MSELSELTLFVLQYGFLLLLWVFVFVLIFALRADVFGGRVRKLPNPSRSPARPRTHRPRRPRLSRTECCRRRRPPRAQPRGS